MRTLFYVLVGLVAFTVSLCHHAKASDHTVPVDVQDAWQFACSVTKTDCSHIQPPTVVIDQIRQGPCDGTIIWGAFTPYIPSEVHLCAAPLYYANPVFIQATLAHEMTHYIDNIKDPDIQACDTEWNAHRVGNAYLASHGYLPWADFDWQDWYGCFGATEENTDGTI